MGDPAFARVEEAIKAGEPIGPDLMSGHAAAVAPAPAAAGAAAVTTGAAGAATATAARPRRSKKKLPSDILPKEAIRLGLPSRTKDEVIRLCGDTLVGIGATDPAYTDAMFGREQQVSTFMGNGIAIPHGTNEGRTYVKQTRLGFLQFPEGVDWDGNTVYVAIPIASNGDEHVGILGALASVLADPASAAQLRSASSPEEVLELLAPEEGE
nr:PTS sugar transporter subunit IIA [Raineyella fluvialis]